MTRDELRAIGIDVDADAHARLVAYVAALYEENRTINLSGAKTVEGLWPHVLDSLALLPWLQAMPAERMLDLGTGGGFPGVPLACVFPTMHVTLLDSTRKKIEAVSRIAATIGLSNAACVWGRSEKLAHEPLYREQFDLVTARAVTTLPRLLENAAGFLAIDGYAWFHKSAEGLREEWDGSAKAARVCGFEPDETLTYRLPTDDRDRVLAGFRKVQPLRHDLPRDAVHARKRAL